MSLKLTADGVEIKLVNEKFPAGESRIQVTRDSVAKIFMVDWKFEHNGEFMELALLVDAVRRMNLMHDYKLRLSIPYMPYTRQDRVCNPGESLSIKVVADFINSLKFDDVLTFDLHSDVSGALINNLHHIQQKYLAVEVASFASGSIIVSPDAGAEKKALAFAQKMGYDFVRATKVRDVATGKILRTTIIDELPEWNERLNKPFLIIDDICDGGRTFIELAKAIRAAPGGAFGQDINLYITHGIFSHGLDELKKHFKKVFVANLLNAKYNDDDFIVKL